MATKKKKSLGWETTIKQGSTKDPYLFCFFPRPQWRWICRLVWLSFDEEEEKATTSTALVSFRASQATYVWWALIAQPKIALTDSTQSSNQSSGRSQAKPQAHTSGPWGETKKKQGVGKKKVLPRSWGLEIGCFTISLSLQLYQQRPDSTI